MHHIAMEGSTKSPSSSIYALVALLTLLLSTSHLKTCHATRSHHHDKTSTEFIRTSCGVTTYPRVCIESLSSHASAIQTNPKQLAHAALSVSLSSAQTTSAIISKLSTKHGFKSKVKGAMEDCIETIGDSIDELQQSIGEVGHLSGPDFDFHMDNIQTWVSAALTDEDTCMDGFEGNALDGEIKNTVRSHVLSVAQMTSNALALVNRLRSDHAKSP
ncbi:21 kDa protein-like [Magnolia sinica]|uniref:21 kDa protein-like n=1 Tax=Magnolia sinica TaxID=86752 RepID=UPI002657FABD|nr:21 kDa protein-like [Magnolia sinica]